MVDPKGHLGGSTFYWGLRLKTCRCARGDHVHLLVKSYKLNQNRQESIKPLIPLHQFAID